MFKTTNEIALFFVLDLVVLFCCWCVFFFNKQVVNDAMYIVSFPFLWLCLDLPIVNDIHKKNHPNKQPNQSYWQRYVVCCSLDQGRCQSTVLFVIPLALFAVSFSLQHFVRWLCGLVNDSHGKHSSKMASWPVSFETSEKRTEHNIVRAQDKCDDRVLSANRIGRCVRQRQFWTFLPQHQFNAIIIDRPTKIYICSTFFCLFTFHLVLYGLYCACA